MGISVVRHVSPGSKPATRINSARNFQAASPRQSAPAKVNSSASPASFAKVSGGYCAHLFPVASDISIDLGRHTCSGCPADFARKVARVPDSSPNSAFNCGSLTFNPVANFIRVTDNSPFVLVAGSGSGSQTGYLAKTGLRI